MSDMQAASQEAQDPRPVVFVVQADYGNRADLLFENRPQRDMDGVLACVRQALERGATEVRVRPHKEMTHAASQVPVREVEREARPEANALYTALLEGERKSEGVAAEDGSTAGAKRGWRLVKCEEAE